MSLTEWLDGPRNASFVFLPASLPFQWMNVKMRFRCYRFAEYVNTESMLSIPWWNLIRRDSVILQIAMASAGVAAAGKAMGGLLIATRSHLLLLGGARLGGVQINPLCGENWYRATHNGSCCCPTVFCLLWSDSSRTLQWHRKMLGFVNGGRGTHCWHPLAPPGS